MGSRRRKTINYILTAVARLALSEGDGQALADAGPEADRTGGQGWTKGDRTKEGDYSAQTHKGIKRSSART